MSESEQIIQADKHHLAAVKDLLSSCQLPHQDLSAAHLKHFFLIEKEKKTVAVIGLEKYGDRGLIRSLAVRKKYRENGLGELLTRRIEKYARSVGIKYLYLLTTTAVSYFNKQGYDKIDRKHIPDNVKMSPQFTEICPTSAVTMKKTL